MVFLPSILEIKFTAVKFKIISMTFDEFTTKTKELKIAIPPCMKRRRHEKITRRVLSSLLAVSKRGKVSTAVHIVDIVIKGCIRDRRQNDRSRIRKQKQLLHGIIIKPQIHHLTGEITE